MPTTEERIADAVLQRDEETAAYEMNQSNYEAILAEQLPTDAWPAKLAKYSMVRLDKIPVDAITDEEAEQIAKYQHRDWLKTLVRTEKAEAMKCRMLSKVLRDKLPKGKEGDCLAQAKARREARVKPER